MCVSVIELRDSHCGIPQNSGGSDHCFPGGARNSSSNFMRISLASQDSSKIIKVLIPGLNQGFERPSAQQQAVGMNPIGAGVRDSARLHESGRLSDSMSRAAAPDSARLHESATTMRMTPPGTRLVVQSETPPPCFPGGSSTASTSSVEVEGGPPHFPGDPVPAAINRRSHGATVG